MRASMPVLKARKSIKVPKNNIHRASRHDRVCTALCVTKFKLGDELSGLSGSFALVLLACPYYSYVLGTDNHQPLPASSKTSHNGRARFGYDQGNGMIVCETGRKNIGPM